MPDFVGAVDQGTTSTRFMIFDHSGNEKGSHQLEHEQILPQAGWVEHNPTEIWSRTETVVKTALQQANLQASDLAAVGITNQRETAVVWNRNTGRPYYNAIVWQDTRTDRIASALEREGKGDVIRRKAGLPPATYFSGGKIQWILENVDGVAGGGRARRRGVRQHRHAGCCGTSPAAPTAASHVTDVTNASRTMLMNLETLDWDDELLGFFNIPRAMLPEIRPSSDPNGYGTTRANGPLGGEILLTGDLGDQQAATVGQVCFAPGEAKNTYGTGNFMLLNTGTELVRSKSGLLTDGLLQVRRRGTGRTRWRARSRSPARPCSGCATSSASSAARRRPRRWPGSVEDNGGVYFVPAFSGLFAPYWRSDARGAIVGLSRFNTNAHLARATLEAICYQSRDVVDAMAKDSGVHAGRAQGRRRHHRQRAVHADPGRRARGRR